MVLSNAIFCWEAAEAVEKAMVEIFLSKAWLKLLEVPQDHREFMVCALPRAL